MVVTRGLKAYGYYGQCRLICGSCLFSFLIIFTVHLLLRVVSYCVISARSPVNSARMNTRKMKLKLKVLFSSFHLNGQLNGQISSAILKVGTAYHTYIMFSAHAVYRTLGAKKFVNNRSG